MARPTFNPDDQQRATLAALDRVATRQAKVDADIDQLLTQGQQQGIPISIMAEHVKLTRKTVYRHLGHPMR